MPTKWPRHVSSHYGLAWVDGVDEPIDMDDLALVARTLQSFMKRENVHSLKCPKCNDVKRSAHGYASHIEVCGQTEEAIRSRMYSCPHCPSVVRKVSIGAHNALCAGLKKQLREERQEEEEEAQNEINKADEAMAEEEDGTRKKRRSAIK